MTAVVERPTFQPVALCPDCGTRPPRNRWGHPLPKRFPETLTPEHVDNTLRLHPWLTESRLGALAANLRDGVVMGA